MRPDDMARIREIIKERGIGMAPEAKACLRDLMIELELDKLAFKMKIARNLLPRDVADDLQQALLSVVILAFTDNIDEALGFVEGIRKHIISVDNKVNGVKR